MRYLTGTTYGCSCKSLNSLYKSLILSTINSEIVAYHTCSESAKKKLQVIQAKALRLCLGALAATPNLISLAERIERPLYIQIK